MKKVISLLLVCMMMLSMVTVVSAANAFTVSLDDNVDATSKSASDYIAVPIRISNFPDNKCVMIEIGITFDHTKVQFQRFWNNSDPSVITDDEDDDYDAEAAAALLYAMYKAKVDDMNGVLTGKISKNILGFTNPDSSVITSGNQSGSVVKALFTAPNASDEAPADISITHDTKGNNILTFAIFKKIEGQTGIATVSLDYAKVAGGGDGSGESTTYSSTDDNSIVSLVNGSIVLSAPEKYDVTAPSTVSGQYTVEGITSGKVNENTVLNFTVAPEDGYEVVVKAGDETLASTNNAYTYTVTANTTISVTASKIQHNITIPVVSNGSVSAPATAGMGDEVTLEVTPASADYVLKSLTVTGPNGAIAVTDNKFTMPNGDVTVDAVFASNVATLSAITVNGNAATIDGTNATIELAEYAANATIVVTKANAEATVEYDNEVVLVEGNNTVAINVTAEDGVTTNAYTLTIVNPADQTVIATVDKITVDGVEAPINGLNATITLAEYAANVTIAVDTTVDGATVTGDGEVALAEGENEISIEVTATNGSTKKTYTLTIVNPENPATIATVEAITVNDVAATIDGTNATVALDVYTEGMAVVVDVDTTVDGADVVVNGGNEIALIEGDTVTVDVVVTALDGVTTETYALAISTEADPFAHDATLAGIMVNGQNAVINGTAATVSLNVYAQTATVVVDTTVDEATYVITSPAEFVVGNNVYTIEVTAKDGVTTETYTLTVVNPTQPTSRPTPSTTGGATGTTLADVKNNVSAKLDSAAEDLNKDEYSEEAWAEIEKLIEDAKADLENAKNVKAAEKIEKELLEAIEAVKTIDEEEPVEDVEIPVDEELEPATIPAPEKSEEEIAAAEALYSDMSGHWALSYIHELSVANSVFKGNEDGTFAPDKGITRQEIAVALGRLLGLEEIAAEVTATDFTDDADIADWAKGYVAIMNELGLLKGNADGSFAANDVITREQLALILSRMVEAPEAVAGMAFDDAEGISDWAADGCAIAYTFGIVKGYPDNTFKGANTVTRAEAVVMIYNYLAAIAD